LSSGFQSLGLLRAVYSLADMFIKTPPILPWEDFSHSAINSQTLFVYKDP